jgi:hypothetical protein
VKMKGFLIALIFAAMTVGLGWIFGPGLVADYRLRNADLVPDESVRIIDASCRSKLLVIAWCQVRISRADEAVTLRYLISGQMDGVRVRILRPRNGGAAVTSSIGVSYLFNRLATFGVATVFLMGLVGGGVRMMRTGR